MTHLCGFIIFADLSIFFQTPVTMKHELWHGLNSRGYPLFIFPIPLSRCHLSWVYWEGTQIALIPLLFLIGGKLFYNCFVGFCLTTMWISHKYTHTLSLLSLPPEPPSPPSLLCWRLGGSVSRSWGPLTSPITAVTDHIPLYWPSPPGAWRLLCLLVKCKYFEFTGWMRNQPHFPFCLIPHTA